jgi:N-acylglucosamine-6-phosphate 2-epimerase
MTILDRLKSKLIISCQAPIASPLHHREIIANIALACIQQGAAGVRIDTPSHIQAVRKILPQTPIIGLWKRMDLSSPVYITPRYADAATVATAGADIIAIDATQRERPDGEKLANIIEKIKGEFNAGDSNKLIMADVDSLENAKIAVDMGADLVGTTLYGYTSPTKHLSPPNYELLATMTDRLNIPVICEGGISTPTMAKQALAAGAYAVVVGKAITGIDLLAKDFQEAIEGIY